MGRNLLISVVIQVYARVTVCLRFCLLSLLMTLNPNVYYLSFRGDARLENMLKLLIIMYANDTVILAHSPDKLQTARNGMEKYCEKWKFKVHFSKTKIIIFGSRKHLEYTCTIKKKLKLLITLNT